MKDRNTTQSSYRSTSSVAMNICKYTHKHFRLLFVTLFLCHLPLTIALHADEAGKVDYTIQTAGHGNIGVQYARIVANGMAILTSSAVPDLYTLNRVDGGCYLSSRDVWTGQLLWRRDVCSMKNAKYAVCAPPRFDGSGNYDSQVYTLDSRGLIRVWDDATGQMIHERSMVETVIDDHDIVTPRFLGCDTQRSWIAATLSNPKHGDILSFINSKASMLNAETILTNAKVIKPSHDSIARFIHFAKGTNIAGDNTGHIIVAFVSNNAYTTLGQMGYIQLSSSHNDISTQISKPLTRDNRSNTALIPIITASIKVIETENGSWSLIGVSADRSKIIICNPDDLGSVITVAALSPSWTQLETIDIVDSSPSLIRISGSKAHINKHTQNFPSVAIWSLADLMRGKRLEPDMFYDNILKCHQMMFIFSTSGNNEPYPHTPSTRVKVSLLSSTNDSVDAIDIHDGPIIHIHTLECKPEIVKFLATTQSGGTYMLSWDTFKKSNNFSQLTLHWTAEEAMAGLTSSFFLDMSRSVAKHVELSDETEETVMGTLSFPSRITSQIDNFKGSVIGGIQKPMQWLTGGVLRRQDSAEGLGENDYTFGFAKIAVYLSSSYAKLLAADTLSKGKLLWSLNLNPSALWHKVVHGSMTSPSSMFGMGHYQPHSHEALVLSSFSEHIVWSCIDLFRGRVLSQSSIPIQSPVVEVFPLYGVTSNCRQGATLLHEDHKVSAVPSLNETLLHSSSVLKSNGVYMVQTDKVSGHISSYHSALQTQGDGESGFSRAMMVGGTFFNPTIERIVSITFPETNEVIQSPASILGDDSLLLKYLNPHICVVVTEATVDSFRSIISEDANSTSKQFYQAIAAKSIYDQGKQKKPLGASNPGEELQIIADGASSKVEPPSTLFINVIDTVSGQTLHRISHTHSDLNFLGSISTHVPVVVSENWIIYAFPNYRSRRTEIGVLTMHEGMIDKNGLTAFKGPEQEKTFSSVTSPKPIVLSKTFGFSKPVSAIGVSQTKGGIAAKNVLFATGIAGQVIRVDRRMLDPRRPVGEPKKSEKEEGLMQ